jgi:hypothetical protein
MNELLNLVIGTVVGLGSGIVFIVSLFIVFCTVVGFSKLRPTAGTLVVKNLEELVGQEAQARYLPATTPRGRFDVLSVAGRRA